MTKVHTKEAAEALLRELPSVLGAYVREDVNGHPREVHLLISAGPDARHLAINVRELLEEKLGVPVDQRVISIAQLAETPVHKEEVSARPEPAPAEVEPRLRFEAVETQSRGATVVLRVRLSWREQIATGECIEVELPQARLRAAAVATLNAATMAAREAIRFQLESASVIRAFGRDYILVSVLASAAAFGRRPLTLTGAQPLEEAPEQAAVLATLKAINRIVAKELARRKS